MQRRYLAVLVTISGILVAVITFLILGKYENAYLEAGAGQGVGNSTAVLFPDRAALQSITRSDVVTAVPPLSSIPTATPKFIVHIVAPGETLIQIGRQYEISPGTLIELNYIIAPDRLKAGQQLLIPIGDSPPGNSLVVERPIGYGATHEATIAPQSHSLNQIPTPTPELPPPDLPRNDALTVNGIPRNNVAFIPPEVLVNSRLIFNQGQQAGRNPSAFSLLGDSVIGPPFFKAYDTSAYNLREHHYLEDVIQYFTGSFGWESISVRSGLHSWTAFDPIWADEERCFPGEGPLPCELRLHNPSFLIIRLGSNDAGAPNYYESQMRQIVEFTITNNVVPVLGTKADRIEESNIYNEIVRRLAADYLIPLWDFDLVAETLPNRGLGADDVHLDGEGIFYQNISGLVMLDRLWREVVNRPRI